MDELKEFQFLIGSLEARTPVWYLRFAVVVSIPHRQSGSKNKVKEYIEEIEFQFLIGSLEAGFIVPISAEDTAFQFLIGSLEATLMGKFAQYLSEFQFLIGSLEALLRDGSSGCSAVSVSIPHRQSGSPLYRSWRHPTSEFQFLIGSLEAPRLSMRIL